MYVKMIIAALIMMCGSTVSNAAEWVLIDPPTYVSRDDYVQQGWLYYYYH